MQGRPLFAVFMLLGACSAPASPSPVRPTSAPPAASSAPPAASSAPPARSPSLPGASSAPSAQAAAAAPADTNSLHLVYKGAAAWELRSLNGKLYRSTKGGREAYLGGGKWERDDFVSGFPSLDVAGQWPSHLFSPLWGRLPQVFEWNGERWRPTSLRYATELQPWVSGSVIARLTTLPRPPDAFVVYGGDPSRVPKPSRRKAQRFDCPHKLDIHGYVAEPDGDLLLWGTECKEASNFPDDYFMERFYPDGRHEEMAFPEPVPLIWSEAYSGKPPVLARSPDDLWVVGAKSEGKREAANGGWVLEHYDGKTITVENLPFHGAQGLFAAQLAAGEGGAMWFTYRPDFGGSPAVWRRAPDGRWAQWQVPEPSKQNRPPRYQYNNFAMTLFQGDMWFETSVGDYGNGDGWAVLSTREQGTPNIE